MFHVKVRKAGARAWWFLSSNGDMNRLRVHAAEFSTLPDVATLTTDNPGYEFKAVSIA
jgi:hypothetical protein